MIKALFFDIDGTLVSFKTHRVADSTIEAVRALRARGTKVFIATGRPRPFIDNLGALPYDGIMCTNGATCMDAEGNFFYKNPIPKEDIERYVAYQRELRLPTILSDNKSIFIAGKEERAEEVEHIMKMLDIKMPTVRPIEEGLDMDVVQVIAFFHSDEEPYIMQNVMKGCNATRWHPSFVDIVAKGTNKATGIDKVCEHYGFDPSETMAFGDGGNDIEMLRHAGVGVAMGNAADEVKAAADRVTTSVDEDGIANVLKELLFQPLHTNHL